MMLSAGEQHLVDQVEAFCHDQLRPAAAVWGVGGDSHARLYAEAARLGLMGLQVPRDQGGLGLGFHCKSRVCERLAAADFGFAMAVVNSHNVAHKLAVSGTPKSMARFLAPIMNGAAPACTALSEPGVGSDAANMRMRATRRSALWCLDGEKAWIINARRARFAVVYAQCGDQGDPETIAAFLVDLERPGCERYAQDSDFSQLSAGTGGIRLSGYQVQDAEVVVPPGSAFRAVLQELNGARVYVAAMCCGMLDSALECVHRYGREREAFGRKLFAHQDWRFTVARAETDLAAVRLATRAAEDAVAQAGADAQLLAAQAKILATECCRRYLPRLMHCMGAAGLDRRYPFARHIAASGVAALADGSTEMLLERVARLARGE